MTQGLVLVLGETAVDVIAQCGSVAIDWGQAERLADDARLVLGSSGAITAAAAAALGLEVAFVGVIGDAFLGDFFLTELGRLGVDTSDVRRSQNGRTGSPSSLSGTAIGPCSLTRAPWPSSRSTASKAST